MFEEFDDDEAAAREFQQLKQLRQGQRSQPSRASGDGAVARARPSVARSMSRLYAAAAAPVRARMLAGLLRPLGPLGLTAIAAGAFAVFVQRLGRPGLGVTLEDVGRYSSQQIFELVHFVEQVSPEAVQQVAGLLADDPAGVAAFSVAVALWILRSLGRPRMGAAEAAARAAAGRADPS